MDRSSTGRARLAAAIAVVASAVFAVDAQPTPSVSLCGDITSDRTLGAYQTYVLSCQTFVKDGVTLTIEPGVTVKAVKVASGTPAAALVVERGAKIDAKGTARAPITFTTAEDVDPSSPDFDPAAHRGLWGGLIIMGKAPVTGFEELESDVEGLEVEGLEGYFYGGDVVDDSSGILSYVRVWYGGSVVGEDNEINGITFAGVGSGTEVNHIEVAYSLDDGVEFFGGSVNVKYLSVLFCGDDGIDTDLGYTGSIQFAVVIVGTGGHHATEMDSSLDAQPRTFPRLYNALLVGGTSEVAPQSSDDRKSGLMRFRQGTGGEFGNIVMINAADHGVRMSDCASEKRMQSLDKPANLGEYSRNYLWFSPNNVISGLHSPLNLGYGCQGLTTVQDIDPDFIMAPPAIHEDVKFMDPRPMPGSPLFAAFDTVPEDLFFEQVEFRGAFGKDLWLSGWSWLSENGRIPDNIDGAVIMSNIDMDMTLKATQKYLLTSQVFVKEDYTLTIEEGTTIYAYSDDGNGKAPCIVIERGAMIMAEGSAEKPITFTSALHPSLLPRRGTWGGLIINGNARVSKEGGSNEVEGLQGVPYGGTDNEDHSGVLSYVRVWYGGSKIAENNEINGITFAGVGNRTEVDHVEVAYNLDDGVEFFGGTVNVKYLSVLFCGDDGIDTDEGYQGKIQFAVVLVGEIGHHGAEMDSMTNGDVDSQPRSFPQLYNALIVGGGNVPDSHSSDDQFLGMMRLREGTGGEFGNLIIANAAGIGVLMNTCGDEDRLQDKELAPAKPNYLWFSRNNMISGAVKDFNMDRSCIRWDLPMRQYYPTMRAYVDVGLNVLPNPLHEGSPKFDLRPAPDGHATKYVDDVPDDGFFEPVDFKGAFAPDNLWLKGWSILHEQGKLPVQI